jgi:beta-lactamase superfamily II metal-dependent hydrolase
MQYNGVEIDMLSLGDADSLLVTNWESGRPTYILIDGGYAKDAPRVTRFLQARAVKKIHHLVCSHLDDDHAAGLLRLVHEGEFEVGCGWVHRPDLHVDMKIVTKNLEKTAAVCKESRIITASLETQRGLAAELIGRDIEVKEPFEGENIGFLKVLGPSEAYYEELVGRFGNPDQLRELLQEREKSAGFNEGRRVASLELLADPEVNAGNLSSTILGGLFGESVLFFTGDAGAESLRRVLDYDNLAGCDWMQIPHHGSINNITQELVKFFKPRVAYVSAEGNDHHPHGAVIRAFKSAGTKVFSTHHPNSGNLRRSMGDVPERGNYSPATPL